MEQMNTALALNNAWLDWQSPAQNNSLLNTQGNYGSVTQCVPTIQYWPYYQSYCYPQYYPHYVYISTPSDHRPIKLTMSEVEKLRKAAKADTALRDVLAKFTAQIEVVVDFGEKS